MNKKHIATTLALIVSITAAACGGGDDKKAEPTRTGPIVSIAPVTGVKPGDEFVATIRIDNVQNLGGYQFTLNYDSSKVTIASKEDADFLKSTGREPACQGKDTPDTLVYACATQEPAASRGSATQTAPTKGPSGGGELVRIRMRVADNASGTIGLQLAGVQVVDPLAQTIQSTGSGADITIE